MVKKISWILSIGISLFLVVLWPMIMMNFGDFTIGAFKFWIVIGQIFIFLSLIYSLFGPTLDHYFALYSKKNNKVLPIKVVKNKRKVKK